MKLGSSLNLNLWQCPLKEQLHLLELDPATFTSLLVYVFEAGAISHRPVITSVFRSWAVSWSRGQAEALCVPDSHPS